MQEASSLAIFPDKSAECASRRVSAGSHGTVCVPWVLRRPERWEDDGVSHVHRLHLSDRIFFVTVNLRRAFAPLSPPEYEQVAAAMEAG
jgi:hypothetical protein